jgi:hypothetical protein
MMDKVSDELDITMNYTNAQDHVPQAERNNRTIKERIRAALHHLPYKKLPKTMVKYLAMVQTMLLNLFPVKGGVSKYFSPRAIITNETLDYEKHCKIPFGSYVQATHETKATNSNLPRTLDAIYLRPHDTIQGGHELFDLTSGRVITRSTVKVIPVTQMVIDAVKRMADDQGMKDFKFKNKYGIVYQDADWLEGVDDEGYEEYNEEYINDINDNMQIPFVNTLDEDYEPTEDTNEYQQEDDEEEIIFEPIEEEETQGLFDDAMNTMWTDMRENYNPIQHPEQDIQEPDDINDNDGAGDDKPNPAIQPDPPELRRSTRTS